MKPATPTRILWYGLLAGVASAALGTWYFLSSSESSSQVISPSMVCDVTPIGEDKMADPGYYTIKFVAYGDIDSDDDVPCGMISDVRIAIIHQKGGGLVNWWEAVGGNELGIKKLIPPGARVPTTAEKLSSAPAQFITTGPDGTVEVTIPYDPEWADYSLCAISSTDNLIAGCSHDLYLREPYLDPVAHITPYHVTVYTYFAHGHAVIEARSSNRYQQFLGVAGSAWAPATLAFTATLGDDIEPDQPYNAGIAIVADTHVNAWWADISRNSDGSDRYGLDKSHVNAELLAHDWVHVITTGSDGSTEITLPPGDYLICGLAYTLRGRTECVYENLASGHHKFIVNFLAGGNTMVIAKVD